MIDEVIKEYGNLAYNLNYKLNICINICINILNIFSYIV